MHPVLLTIGPFTLYSFGLFLFVGFMAGAFVVWKYGRRFNIPDEKILDAIIYAVAVGLVFSRVFYCLINNNVFGLEIGKWILFLRYPGFSLIGAVFGGLSGLALFSYKNKVSALLILDIFSIGYILGKLFGNFGSFLNGSDVGTKTTAIVGVMAAGFDGKRHPVSLYDSVFAFFVLIILIKFLSKRKSEGMVFAFFVFLYGLYSLILEFVRADALYLAGIRFGFIGSGFLVIISLPLMYFLGGGSVLRDLRTIIAVLFNKVVSFKVHITGLYLLFYRRARILLSRFRKHDKNIK